MASYDREAKMAFERNELQDIILKAVFHGHLEPARKAIEVLSRHFDDSQPHDGKQLLDFFPEIHSATMPLPRKHCFHSPLMIACEEDRDDIVQLLVSNGASVALKNKNGLTAIHIACRMGRKDILSELIAKAKTQKHFNFKKNMQSDYEVAMSAKAREGWTPLLYVVKEGHLDILKECFSEEQCHGMTKKKQNVLHIAAKHQRFECLKELMSRPSITIDLKLAIDKKGWNILHHGCAGGDIQILEWLVENVPELRSAIMLNQRTNSGYTPLLIACEYQNAKAVQYLLTLPEIDVSTCAESVSVGEEDSSDVEAKGKSALHIAAIHDSVEIAEMLIEKGCPMLVQDLEGNTALHVAYRKSSNEVGNLLRISPDGKKLEETLNFETVPKLPHSVLREDIIPPEIKKKGKAAVEIYKRALQKGKQKIPRCNLLILGEERTGKTSVLRQLVGKEFNPNQDSTMGIDNTVVETVDTMHVASSTWEEKSSDDQKKQSKDLFALGVVKQVKEELPAVNDHDFNMDSSSPVSKKKLMDAVKRIEKILLDRENEIQHSHEHKFRQPSYYHQRYTGSSLATLKEVRPEKAPISSQVNNEQPRSLPRPVIADVSSKLNAGHKNTPEIHEIQNSNKHKPETAAGARTTTQHQKASEDSKPKQVSHSNEAFLKKKEKNPTTKHAFQLSRGHSKRISKLMKSDLHDHKEITLTYNALDFAGQKEYHPMHHCFITRRAIYLVVFNLQKMLKFVKEKMLGDESPLEQIRYWLHSIHAHVFPPNEGDHMRRVCLVGTHRMPKKSEEVAEEQLKEIDAALRTLESDERCVSHIHYTSQPERMFVAVENSMDDKKGRELSGILQLQSELKEISDKLTFLKEDHPIIWLNFEAQLIAACNVRKQQGLSVVVPVQELSEIASQLGIDEKENQHLALDFFHDTGKIICLDRLPTLFLLDQEDKILQNLVILDPAWLIGVMKVIMGITRKSEGDQSQIIKLIETGIASESLLRQKWAGLFSESESESSLSFPKLCLMLQAYCLVFPLKGLKSKDEPERSSPSGLEIKPVTSFLVPSMLPEIADEDEVDCGVPWVNFFFDFEKFLPEEIYHRLICIMLANTEDHCSEDVRPKFSKLWSCFYDVDESHWRFEFRQDEHRLKVSIQTKDENKRREIFFKVHDYLHKICESSHLQGLKYYGGPEVKCRCKTKVLRFTEYNDKMNKREKEAKCRKCFQEFKLDEAIDAQVPKPEPHPITDDDVTDEGAVSKTKGITEVNTLAGSEKPTLKELMRSLRNIAADWEDLGIELEIDDGELKLIKRDNPGDSKSCLRELLRTWLNCVNPEPSWTAIAEAVEKGLGNQELASTIRYL